MSRRGFARARDANEPEIVIALRQFGYVRRFDEPVDLLFFPHGGLSPWWLEVKDGRKPPADRPLTSGQVTFFCEYPGKRAVVRCVEEAICRVGAMPCRVVRQTTKWDGECGCGEVDDPPWFVEQRAAEVEARKVARKAARPRP